MLRQREGSEKDDKASGIFVAGTHSRTALGGGGGWWQTVDEDRRANTNGRSARSWVQNLPGLASWVEEQDVPGDTARGKPWRLGSDQIQGSTDSNTGFLSNWDLFKKITSEQCWRNCPATHPLGGSGGRAVGVNSDLILIKYFILIEWDSVLL